MPRPTVIDSSRSRRRRAWALGKLLGSGEPYTLQPLVSASLLGPLDADAPGRAHVNGRPSIAQTIAAVDAGLGPQARLGAWADSLID